MSFIIENFEGFSVFQIIIARLNYLVIASLGNHFMSEPLNI